MNVFKKIQLCLLSFFSLYCAADNTSSDEMIMFVVEEQFLSQQRISLEGTLETMFQPMGVKVNSAALAKFVDPMMGKYMLSIKKKAPDLYKEIYSEDEITAIYTFMKSDVGKSITAKQGEFVKQTMVLTMDESLIFLQEIGVAIEQDPQFFESIIQPTEDPFSPEPFSPIEPTPLEPISFEPMLFDPSLD
jgi:hypothetical protein